MRRVLFAVFLLAGAAANAATLYQWRDESGAVHFTDNPANVPPKYRQEGKRDVDAMEAVKGVPLVGQEIWSGKCAECHFFGEGHDSSRRFGLFQVVVDIGTRFPFSNEQIKATIVPMLNGASSEMPVIKLTDKELDSLVEYMRLKIAGP